MQTKHPNEYLKLFPGFQNMESIDFNVTVELRGPKLDEGEVFSHETEKKKEIKINVF